MNLFLAIAPSVICSMIAVSGLRTAHAAGEPAAAVSADNTKNNIGDSQPGVVTADKQENKSTDVEITRQIRERLIQDSNLSLNAHNIKVITKNGHVTLKGPVESKQERSKIVHIVKSSEGVAGVTNKLSFIK